MHIITAKVVKIVLLQMHSYCQQYCQLTNLRYYFRDLDFKKILDDSTGLPSIFALFIDLLTLKGGSTNTYIIYKKIQLHFFDTLMKH